MNPMAAKALLLVCLPALASAAGVRVQFDPRDPQTGPFPTDFLTTSDGAQRTFRRVNLPMPDCNTRPSDCGEVRLINSLDGFSPNARLTVRFSGAINPETLKGGLSYVWLNQLQAGRQPVKPEGTLTAANQVVYDPATNTGYAKPDLILEGARRYLVIVTDAVRDRAGDPVETDSGFQLCLDGRVGGDYCKELAEAVDRVRASVNPRRIVGASLFTTLSTTAWLEQAAAIVHRVGPNYRRQRDPVSLANIQSITLREQTATRGDNRFSDTVLPFPTALLAQFGVGRVAFGSFRSPRFIAPNQIIPPVPSSGEMPMPAETEEIFFHVWLPAQPAPPGGYPVLLAGHGITDSRFGMPTFAALAASAGFAVVAMNAVGHGRGPETAVRLGLRDGTTLEVAAPGRGVDLTGDGRIDSVEGCIFTVPGAPLGGRECLRQTAVDYMQMVHAIRDGMDLDGDSTPDLNPGAILYLSQSMGGFYGTLALAVIPEISAAVVNVPGGSLAEAGRISPVFRPVFTTSALATRQPALLNKGDDFDEDMPLRDQPVRVRTLAGAAELQDFFERVEWIESLGAPAAVAAHLRTAPIPGIRPKRVLFQIALGDQSVPNPVNSALIRAAGAQEQTSLYRHDRARTAVPELAANPHTFLVPLGPPQQQLISLAAAQQALAFLGGLDLTVPDVNTLLREAFRQDLFEVPAALPEATNFQR